VGVDKQEMTEKLVGVGVALAAAWIAQQLIAGVWRASLGHRPPKVGDDAEAPFLEVAAAAVATGAVVALARLLAARGTARYLGSARHPR